MQIQEAIAALENFAPLPLQEDYDNAGLQIGLTESKCSGVLLCLDVTEDVIAAAASRGCNLIVSHHPLLFRGLKRIGDDGYVERCVRRAILATSPEFPEDSTGITIYSAHTNLDNAPGALRLDGVTIDRYACSSELTGASGTTLAGIGTACHEFSHCLGLLDAYDVDYSGAFGMGCWSLMDSGSYNAAIRTANALWATPPSSAS